MFAVRVFASIGFYFLQTWIPQKKQKKLKHHVLTGMNTQTTNTQNLRNYWKIIFVERGKAADEGLLF